MAPSIRYLVEAPGNQELFLAFKGGKLDRPGAYPETVFDVENGQVRVLGKPFLNAVAALRREKMAKPGSKDDHLQAEGWFSDWL